jgi:hypothetical protein
METAKKALAASMIFGLGIGTAHAEICYRLVPFPDVVRVTETMSLDEAVEGSHTAAVGNWSFANAYSLPVVGSLDTDVPRANPPVLRLGLHGTQHTAAFGNHSDCTLDGIPNGPWTLSCSGRVAGIFNNSGSSLATISCDTLSTSATVGGKGAGQN